MMPAIPTEALDAAKEAMREVTPPPGVSKADWLDEHGTWALFAGAIAAAAPFIAAQAQAAAELPAAPEIEPVDLGYLCHHGHFIFHDDPDVDYACGTKRIADVIVRPIEGAFRGQFNEALDEARKDFGAAIGRAYN